MDFIHEGAAEGPISLSVQDYRVWRSLKSVGYEFVHFGSWLESTRRNPYADMNINYNAMPEFSSYLFQTTWAYPICLELNITDQWWEEQYKRVLYKFDRLAEIMASDFARAEVLASNSITLYPASPLAWAMPDPMVPAPMMPTV